MLSMTSTVKPSSSHPTGLPGWWRPTIIPTAAHANTGMTAAASTGTVS
jgi:hypothetical protein